MESVSLDQRFFNKCILVCKNRKFYEIAYEKQIYFVKVMSKHDLELTNYANYFNHAKVMKNQCKNVVKIIIHFEHENNIYFVYEKGESIL